VPKLNALARARMKSPAASGQPRITSQKSRDDTVSKISSLRGVDTKLANMICDEILDSHTAVHWHDIVGQDAAKDALREMVILPALRPEFFTGLYFPSFPHYSGFSRLLNMSAL
jgi:spastin